MNFEQFDKMVDLDGLKRDIEKAGSTDYEEVPIGTYEVQIDKLELKESKKGDPMVACWFRILNGDYEGYLLFMNQVIIKGFQIHIVNELLRSLESGCEVDFLSYSQYAALLNEISEAVENSEYELDYGEKKGYKTFNIVRKYD